MVNVPSENEAFADLNVKNTLALLQMNYMVQTVNDLGKQKFAFISNSLEYFPNILCTRAILMMARLTIYSKVNVATIRNYVIFAHSS